MQIEIPARYAGPPSMGHGGFVAGLFTSRTDGPVQVTLRRPTPLDVPLDIAQADDGRWELRQGDDLIADSQGASLEIDVPPVPSLEQAKTAEAGSPSFFNERGVHPTCFGCGAHRPDGDGLRIFVGPTEVDGTDQVAGTWVPGPDCADADGGVDAQWVLAALDCAGAFAFIVDDKRAGLLGRIVFEQYGPVQAKREYVVTGWQIGEDGKKMLAGTALVDPDGTVLAAARATWFPFAMAG
ncbi:MAG: hypothetical protein ACXIVQ_16775 [Acidimicrobiales bacterium]